MRIMAITIKNIVNYYIKKMSQIIINKKNASKRFASFVQNIIPYFLLSDMGAIDPIILTLSQSQCIHACLYKGWTCG